MFHFQRKTKPTSTSDRMEQGGGGGSSNPSLAPGPKSFFVSPPSFYLPPSLLPFTFHVTIVSLLDHAAPPKQLSRTSYCSLRFIVCSATREFFSTLKYGYVSLLLKSPQSLQIPNPYPDWPAGPCILGPTYFSDSFSSHSLHFLSSTSWISHM